MRCFIAWVMWLCLLPSATLAAEKASGLLGQWSCQGDEGVVALEFRTQNKLIYGGEPSSYKLRPGMIVTQGEFGPEEYRYTLKGDRLNVVFPLGQQIQCRRVEASAKGNPAVAGSGNPAQLRGRLCKYSGSSSSYSGSSYSSLASAKFDGQGHLVYGSESSFSGQAGIGYGSSGGARGTYRINGDKIFIQLEDGSTATAQVHFRQRDGSITELMINGSLWATGLCE